MIFSLFVLGLMVFLIAAMWKVYEKAGQPGWASIVPIYSALVLLQIVKKPWWWLLLMLIPFAGVIWVVWTYNLLSKSFNKTEAFTLGLIFLPFIFLPILGFGDATYQGEKLDPANDQILDAGLV